MLKILLGDMGWRHGQAKNIASMLLEAREVITNVELSDSLGETLVFIYISRFHDSWPNVYVLIATNTSYLGIWPYENGPNIQDTLARSFRTVSTL